MLCAPIQLVVDCSQTIAIRPAVCIVPCSLYRLLQLLNGRLVKITYDVQPHMPVKEPGVQLLSL